MKQYEDLIIEIVEVSQNDIITTSGAFDGEDDEIGDDWN